MRLILNDQHAPSLLKPARVNVFASRTIGKGKRSKAQGVGWQAWNEDATMEDRIARLPGAGSFYWPNALRAYLAARDMMRADASIHQVSIETISAEPVARIYR